MQTINNSPPVMDALKNVIIGNTEFKVTPEQLNAKAIEVQQKVKQISDRFDAITQNIRATAGYWQGDAATTLRTHFDKICSDVPEMLQALNSYSVKLNTIAGNYAQAEQEVEQIIETLPSDVII